MTIKNLEIAIKVFYKVMTDFGFKNPQICINQKEDFYEVGFLATSGEFLHQISIYPPTKDEKDWYVEGYRYYPGTYEDPPETTEYEMGKYNSFTLALWAIIDYYV